MNAGVLLQVPPFPPVATKLLRLPSDDLTGAAAVLPLLRADPALSAEIIRSSNSALFGLQTQVTALDQALMLLGMRKIRSLALAAIMRTYMRAVLIVDDLRLCWRYSVACALLAERIAGSDDVAEDTAYSAALLHDIGRLALMVAEPVEYPALLQAANEDLQQGKDVDLLQEERELLGMDRYDAGEWLARRWSLPEDLRAAAGRYPDSETHPGLIRVVWRASRIANSLGFDMVADPRRPSYEQVRAALGPEFAAHLPHRAEDLRSRIEKEISLLDWDPCAFEQESAARMLLNLEDPPAVGPTPAQVLPLWSLIAGCAVTLVLLLAILKLTAGL